MLDLMQMRLAEVIHNERIEAAARSRQFASKPATFDLIERLRGALGASVRQPVLPAARSPRKLHS